MLKLVTGKLNIIDYCAKMAPDKSFLEVNVLEAGKISKHTAFTRAKW